MKQLISCLVAVLLFFGAKAQKDTLPPYRQVPYIPAFTIQLTDSSNFSKKDIPKNKPVVIIYFNPECSHCQAEAEELSKNMDKFKKVFFVMASYNEMDLIKQFAASYGLEKFSNLRIGRDGKYFIPVFYQVKTTPFSAVYDKKGKLVKAFEHGMTTEELEKTLRELR